MNSFPFESSLLYPIALVGLLSLVIPILIHLFNPSRGKLVLIGNLDFIKKIKNVRVTEVKINQWLILLIRLIIFLLLSLLLAGWVKQNGKEYASQSHIFITPDWLNNATEEELTELRKRHKDDPVFMLAPNFKKVKMGSLEAQSETKKNTIPKIGINTLLAEMQHRNLATKNTIIYATNRLLQYSPERVENPSNSAFDWRIKQLDINPQSAFKTQITTSLNIAVYYSPSRQMDNRYLKLVLDTISKISEVNLVVKFYPADKANRVNTISVSDKTKADWLFWLSEDAIPKVLSKQAESGSYLFVDMPEGIHKTDNHRRAPIAIKIEQSWTNFYSGVLTQNNSNFKPIWYNRTGQTALSVESTQHGKIFRFNSRLNPDWNDLVSSVDFPSILAGILNSRPNMKQQKLISPSELTAVARPAKNDNDIKAAVEIVNTPLRSFLLLIICLLWLIERWLSEKQGSAYE